MSAASGGVTATAVCSYLRYRAFEGDRVERLLQGARVQDRDAAAEVVARACIKVPGLKTLYTDAAYGGKCAQTIVQTYGITVEVVRHPGNRARGTWQDAQQPLWPGIVAKGFVVPVKRWVVERTHA